MMRQSKLQHFATVAVAGTLIAAASTAIAAETVSYADLEAGAGYSSNPFLRSDSASSIFGRISAFALHSWRSERGATTLTGFVENDTYLRRNGSNQIFALTARTDHSASEAVRLFGNLDFSGDRSGQLSNRFVPQPLDPVIPDPTLPPPPDPDTLDPDFFTLTGRQYRLGGQAGASIKVSEISSMTVTAGARRVFFSGRSGVSDYTILSGSIGYDRRLSERTSIGLRLNGSRTTYDEGDNDSAVLSPQVTVRTSLGENWDLNAAVGVSLAERDSPAGKDRSAGLAFNASLCRQLENERICGRVARTTRSTGGSNLANTNSAFIDFSKRIDDKQTVQASVGVIRQKSIGTTLAEFESTYYSATGSYSRRLNNRLSGGATLGARRLNRDGPDPNMDLSASLFLRLRLGDRQ